VLSLGEAVMPQSCVTQLAGRLVASSHTAHSKPMTRDKSERQQGAKAPATAARTQCEDESVEVGPLTG
jgi:hypothetical protein